MCEATVSSLVDVKKGPSQISRSVSSGESARPMKEDPEQLRPASVRPFGSAESEVIDLFLLSGSFGQPD